MSWRNSGLEVNFVRFWQRHEAHSRKVTTNATSRRGPAETSVLFLSRFSPLRGWKNPGALALEG